MPPTYTTLSGDLHLSMKAFSRFCEICDRLFESTTLALERAKSAGTKYFSAVVPFGTLRDLLSSASKGDCHFCCSLVAQVLASESAHLITGQNLKPDEQVYPSLQPVVSQGVFLGTEIKPAINKLTAGGEKVLWFSMCSPDTTFYNGIKFCLSMVDEDGKLIELFNLDRILLQLTCPDRVRIIHDDGTYATRYPTSLNTGSEESLNQALRWSENCVSNHPSCNQVHENSRGRYPARFLDVGCTGSRTVKLTETTGMDFQEQRYMTLSHCWGDSVPARLLLDNYDSRLKGFALDELPRTFQDAILLTQMLNVQFLWIDSLCIIQDSLDDWGAESAKMRFVYQNTYLNLAAAVSPNSGGGFFFPRYPLSFVPWSTTLATSTHSTLLAQTYGVEEPSILHTRGWVLQEQILPRRTLISGRQELYWECSQGRGSEYCKDSISTVELYLSNSGVFTPSSIELFKRERLLDPERLEAWASLVDDYSNRKLTKQSDKLVAISGLAEHLSNGWDGVTYLAGLWSYRLRDNLLWRCMNVQQSKGRNTDIAPSWSWASLSAQCRLNLLFPSERVDSLAEVLEAMVSPVTPTYLFGQVRSGGMIRIRGPLLRVSLTANLEEVWRYRNMIDERDDIWALLPHYRMSLSWDQQEPQGSAIIYLAPLHILFYSRERKELEVKGLLLRPALTSPRRKGVFERLGVFRTTQNIDLSNQDHLTLYDTLREKFEATSIDRLSSRRTDVSDEERMNLLKSDPYLNGPLNTKLKHRHSPELEPEQYPVVAQFLDCLERAAQYNRESDSPDENLGQDEGNGFYIYELV